MKLQGKGVSGGVAIARIRFLDTAPERIEKQAAADPQAEVARFESARGQAAFQLGKLAVETRATLGEQNSLLFEIHQMMLEDLDYVESVIDRITGEKVVAEYAVQETAQEFAVLFSQMEDPYMRERAADVKDVSARVINLLTGREEQDLSAGEPAILAGEDFAPSETAQFDRTKVLALVTAGGAGNSHTAIFARTMGIPAVIGLGAAVCRRLDGRLAAVDGDTGEVLVDPDEAELGEFRRRQEAQQRDRRALEVLRGRPTVTRDGRPVKLYANIGSVEDAALAMENDAEGIGLFRSEFLYLESETYPSEEVQYEAYRAVAEKMEGRPVIIRTLDIGADKQAAYFQLPQEENPAMGMRAIRICLTRPEIFKTQLRAIYRASAHGKVLIMFPMIASLPELMQAKEIAAQVRGELDAQGVPFDPQVPLGIMVETPAAAVISDLLAPEADFFSLGTNDLTQYTLAVDRQNQSLEQFCDTRHEAVLRLIRTTVENAHRHGIWAGICGELAGDHTLLPAFLEMGVDELSVAPSAVLPLRRRIVEA